MRRLVAKVSCNLVATDRPQLLAPCQLGYGVHGGSEAAVHAARLFLNTMSTEQCQESRHRHALNYIIMNCIYYAHSYYYTHTLLFVLS